ncbi:hypothetical protein M2135_001425 [Parabacteroides sp. PF5-9]|nr:hypothetical protein [Parabacteroides sp. PF5-9]
MSMQKKDGLSSVVTIIISIFNKYNWMLTFELFQQKYTP